ncbi:DNA-processing protein DprA [Methylocaldum sp. MU1018]
MTAASSEHSEELRYWLALHRAPLIGSRRFCAVLAHFRSPRVLFEAKAVDLVALGLKEKTIAYLRRPDWQTVESDLRWLSAAGHDCLTLHDPRYPALLREIPDPPPLIFVKGDVSALSSRQIAIVGSRNPSPSGRRIAREIASALVSAGFAVTSGLALGIDAAGHSGALERGGVTVAVAATGLDRVYPRQHQNLADDIVARNGALVSEFPPGTGPKADHFPRRNRIISGLSLGTLIVEAAPRSGSLITARLAAEQGREVFAVPGSIYNPLSRGCNELIKNGAKLVQTVDDIVEEFETQLPVQSYEPLIQTIPEDDQPHKGLLKYIAYDPTSVDTLVAATGNTPEAIASMLLLLELQGHVASTPGGCYFRTR